MRRLLLVGIVPLALAGLAWGAAARGGTAPTVIEPAPDAAESPAAPPDVVVDVAGAVARPGVVRLAAGARVVDAIRAAGGALPEADQAALNRAAPLRDGARVYVPRAGETPPAGALGSESETKVDLNSASEAELVALPGIGPATATRILRARQARRFARIEELQTRGLLPPRAFAEIRDLITVR